MSLPKLSSPMFSLVLPSNGQEIKYRPYTVEEEKILLMAKQANDQKESIRAIRQVVNNCLLDEIDVNSLATFDLEWIYLQLRIKSVSDETEIYIIDEDDKKRYDFVINLNEIKIVNLDKQKIKIELQDNIGIIMKYPTYELLETIQTMSFDNPEDLFEIIYLCMEMIYDDDKIYPAADIGKDELKKWFSTMNSKLFAKVVEFFEEMPKLQYTITYTNTLEEKKEVILSGVTDFFIS